MILILMWANPLLGPLEGVGPEIFWAQMALAAINGPKKSQFHGPPLPMALVMYIAHIKIMSHPDILYINNMYIYSYYLCHTVVSIQAFEV